MDPALLKRLPVEFDWRNVRGINFVDQVKNQVTLALSRSTTVPIGSGVGQRCGACYAVSTTSMVDIRIRIATNNSVKLNIPWEQVSSCCSAAAARPTRLASAGARVR